MDSNMELINDLFSDDEIKIKDNNLDLETTKSKYFLFKIRYIIKIEGIIIIIF